MAIPANPAVPHNIPMPPSLPEVVRAPAAQNGAGQDGSLAAARALKVKQVAIEKALLGKRPKEAEQTFLQLEKPQMTLILKRLAHLKEFQKELLRLALLQTDMESAKHIAAKMSYESIEELLDVPDNSTKERAACRAELEALIEGAKALEEGLRTNATLEHSVSRSPQIDLSKNRALVYDFMRLRCDIMPSSVQEEFERTIQIHEIIEALLQAYFTQNQQAFAAKLLEISNEELPYIDALVNAALLNWREEYEKVAPSPEENRVRDQILAISNKMQLFIGLEHNLLQGKFNEVLMNDTMMRQKEALIPLLQAILAKHQQNNQIKIFVEKLLADVERVQQALASDKPQEVTKVLSLLPLALTDSICEKYAVTSKVADAKRQIAAALLLKMHCTGHASIPRFKSIYMNLPRLEQEKAIALARAELAGAAYGEAPLKRLQAVIVLQKIVRTGSSADMIRAVLKASDEAIADLQTFLGESEAAKKAIIDLVYRARGRVQSNKAQEALTLFVQFDIDTLPVAIQAFQELYPDARELLEKAEEDAGKLQEAMSREDGEQMVQIMSHAGRTVAAIHDVMLHDWNESFMSGYSKSIELLTKFYQVFKQVTAVSGGEDWYAAIPHLQRLTEEERQLACKMLPEPTTESQKTARLLWEELFSFGKMLKQYTATKNECVLFEHVGGMYQRIPSKELLDIVSRSSQQLDKSTKERLEHMVTCMQQLETVLSRQEPEAVKAAVAQCAPSHDIAVEAVFAKQPAFPATLKDRVMSNLLESFFARFEAVKRAFDTKRNNLQSALAALRRIAPAPDDRPEREVALFDEMHREEEAYAKEKLSLLSLAHRLHSKLPPSVYTNTCAAITRLDRTKVRQNQELDWMIRYDVDAFHLSKGNLSVKPAPKPTGSTIREVLALFDTINFSKPAEPCYYNPETTFRGFREEFRRAHTEIVNQLRSGPQALEGENLAKAVAEEAARRFQSIVRKKLESVLNVVESRNVDFAPADPKIFYEPFENGVIHTVRKLQKNEKEAAESPQELKVRKEETVHTLIPLIEANGYCFTRYRDAAIKGYRKVVLNIPTTFEADLYEELADYRDELFRSSIAPTSTQSIHYYIQAVQTLGKEFGIPSTEELLQGGPDRFMAGATFDAVRDRTRFQGMYTVENIMAWTMNVLKSKYSVAYQNWWKGKIPATWTAPEIEAAKMKLQELIRAEKSKHEIGGALEAMLHVQYRVDKSHEEMILEAKREQKLSTDALAALTTHYDATIEEIDAEKRKNIRAAMRIPSAVERKRAIDAANKQRQEAFVKLEKNFEDAVGVVQYVEKSPEAMIQEYRVALFLDKIVQDPQTAEWKPSAVLTCLESLKVIEKTKNMKK